VATGRRIGVTDGSRRGADTASARPADDAPSLRRDVERALAAPWRGDVDGWRLAGGAAFALAVGVAAGPVAGGVGLAVALGVAVGLPIPLAIVGGTLAVLGGDPSPTTLDAVVIGTGIATLVIAGGTSRRFALVGVGLLIVFGSVLGVALTETTLWLGAASVALVAGLASYTVYRYGLVRLDLVEVSA
jgi:hypothetical protein